MSNAYANTVKKLESAKEKIKAFSQMGDWDGIEQVAATLRSYKDCFYCIDFRDTLEDHFSGCCKRCPCHWHGEKILGRTRAYNGCYVAISYREMVRKATWYNTERNAESAKVLIDAIEYNLQYMCEHKQELDI